jgi:hypothetical protein
LRPVRTVRLGDGLDPVRGGGEQHPVSGLAGPDRQPDRELGFAGAGWSEEDDFILVGDEINVPRWAMRSRSEAAGVDEVELLQRLSGKEVRVADAALTAVRFPGSHLTCRQAKRNSPMRPAA